MTGLEQYLYAEAKETFAGIIQFMRERAGYSQAEFGARIGKDQAAISKYELKKRLPSEKALTAIIGDLCVSELERFTVRHFWRQSRK